MASFNAGKTKIGSQIIHRSAREILSGNSAKESKFSRYNTLVKVTIILTILGLVMYIALGLYQDKMKENRRSIDFAQSDFVAEPPPLAETSKPPTAGGPRIQFPIEEKPISEGTDNKPEIGEGVDRNALDSYRQKSVNPGDIEESY
jgi:preprotein translocase subunit SecG